LDELRQYGQIYTSRGKERLQTIDAGRDCPNEKKGAEKNCSIRIRTHGPWSLSKAHFFASVLRWTHLAQRY